VHGFEDGELQQRRREPVSQGEDKGGLLSKQLLHGVLQPQVQSPITLHEVRQTAAGLQKLFHLRIDSIFHFSLSSISLIQRS